MSEQGARRFDLLGRRIGLSLALALGVLLVVWLTLLRPWPFAPSGTSFERRLDSTVLALGDQADRIEAGLRLKFFEAELVDGRRSSELRIQYRVLEEQIESILARMEPEERSALESELSGLPPDLSRDRRAARERLVELQELLLPTVGLSRQGAGR